MPTRTEITPTPVFGAKRMMKLFWNILTAQTLLIHLQRVSQRRFPQIYLFWLRPTRPLSGRLYIQNDSTAIFRRKFLLFLA